MDESKKIELIKLYEEMPEEKFINLASLPKEDYQEGVYELILEISEKRKLIQKIEAKKKELEEIRNAKEELENQKKQTDSLDLSDYILEQINNPKIVATYLCEPDAFVALGILKENGISSQIFSDNCGGMRPYMSFGTGINVIVDERDYSKALDLLENMNKNP